VTKTLSLLLALALPAAISCKKTDDAGKAGEPAAGKTAEPAASGKVGGDVIRVDGSSTVFPISQATAEDFQATRGGKITVAESGTGGGFKKFCRGELDVTGASRPIKQEELDACKAGGIEFVELPVAYDGLAVVVHKDNAFVDHLTVDELKAMWAPEAQDKVKTWKQIRPAFPDSPLHLFGPGVDSGTYDYFTQAIVGKEHSSRGDFTSSEDDNILVQGVSTDAGALGFFGFAYYAGNADKLKLVPIDDGKPDNGAGPIAPSEATVNDGTYQPLSRPIFVYVSTKALARPEVAAYLDFYLSDAGTALVKEVGYVALPAKVTELARARLAARKVGSAFTGGSQIGVSLEARLSAP
jgi:phosphate transport system substrate-binding protein